MSAAPARASFKLSPKWSIARASRPPVKDITEQAGINRATFYAHFPDKFALLQHSIEQEFRQEVEKRMLNGCQFSNHNLLELIVAVCEYVANTHARCPTSEENFQSLVETQVRTQVYRLLNK